MPAAEKLKTAADRLHEADHRIDQSVKADDAGQPVKTLLKAGEAGDQGPLRLLSSAVVVMGLIATDRRVMRAGIRMFLAHETATLAKNVVKDSVNRTRPRSAQSSRDRELKPGENGSKEVSSFPSGHSAGAIAVARAFSREYPVWRVPALAAASAVAIAQVPRRAHYMSDVAAGLIIGAAVEALTNLYWRAGGEEQEREGGPELKPE